VTLSAIASRERHADRNRLFMSSLLDSSAIELFVGFRTFFSSSLSALLIAEASLCRHGRTLRQWNCSSVFAISLRRTIKVPRLLLVFEFAMPTSPISSIAAILALDEMASDTSSFKRDVITI
jgi:hypothetical protein